jgi:hypothetical protein
MMPKNLQELHKRSKQLIATVLNAHTVIVSSASSPTGNHVVTLQYGDDGIIHARCTCPWAQNGGVACSHVMAALERLAAFKGRKLSFWNSREEAVRQKKRLFRIGGYKDQGIWITSRSVPPPQPNNLDAA